MCDKRAPEFGRADSSSGVGDSRLRQHDAAGAVGAWPHRRRRERCEGGLCEHEHGLSEQREAHPPRPRPCPSPGRPGPSSAPRARSFARTRSASARPGKTSASLTARVSRCRSSRRPGPRPRATRSSSGRRATSRRIRPLQERERVDRRAVVRMHLEVEMRMDAVRVAGVADEADGLARLRPCAPSFSPGAYAVPGDALAAVVVAAPSGRCSGGCTGTSSRSCRTDRACSRRVAEWRPEHDLARLGGNGDLPLLGHQVVPGCGRLARGSPKSSR